MAWYNKQNEQAQEQWNSRVAHKRLDLSISVEEALKDDSVQEDREPGEADKSVKPSKGTTLIPPRLSLQSKYMPAVPSNVTSASDLLPAPAAVEREASSTENSNILSRLAQRLTSSLTTFSGMLQPTPTAEREGSSNSPKVDGAPSTSSIGHTAHSAAAARLETSRPAHSSEVSAPVQTGQRFAGHNTKVRLQVVPKQEKTPPPEVLDIPLHTAATVNPSLPTLERLENAAGTIVSEPRADSSGSGSFESGQSDVAVANANITTSSVVVIVLTGDPGPVVVQYVTLQPKVGFTAHLSAPTKNTTPFNYSLL